jgi:hypothetical protein
MAEAWAGRYIGIVALSVIFFLTTASWALQPEGPETQKPLTRGFHQLEFAPDNGVSLRCSLWVPPLEDQSTVPLVVALHYGGEVIDIEPTRLAIESLRARGARVELIVVTGPTHYQTQAVVAPLKEAVVWLRHLWEEGS